MGAALLIYFSTMALLFVGVDKRLLAQLMPIGLLVMLGGPFVLLRLTGRHAVQLGLGCPDCRRPLVSARGASVAETGLCPHCNVRVVDASTSAASPR